MWHCTNAHEFDAPGQEAPRVALALRAAALWEEEYPSSGRNDMLGR